MVTPLSNGVSNRLMSPWWKLAQKWRDAVALPSARHHWHCSPEHYAVIIIIGLIIVVILCHRGRCSGEPGSGQQNRQVYTTNRPACTSFTFTIETGDTWNHWAVKLVQYIVRRATLITGEPRESTFLFQQLSIGLPKGKCGFFPQHL